MEDQEIEMTQTLIAFTSNIVEAYVSNNSAEVDDIPVLINSVYSTLSGLSGATEQEEERPEPAVFVRASVKPDYLVCLEDGKKLKMLKRHLKTAYDMTPEEYRAKWGLSADYPMVAPAYARKRQELAKQIGLGRKPGTKVRSKK